jgi:mRNA-degrading endonuclease RelE of RelBE toxin-antitoxin system
MPRPKKTAVKSASEHSALLSYEVDMTATAEAAYRQFARQAKSSEAAGNYVSSHCTTFNMIKEAIQRTIPSDPLNKSYALRGDLSNIFRLRKGRLRICWIASSQLKRVCILSISENLRKEGDANEPYVIFQNLLETGIFDEMIDKFGVRIPPRVTTKSSQPN